MTPGQGKDVGSTPDAGGADVAETYRGVIADAQAIIRQRHAEGRHRIGAALLTRAGRRFAAVNVEAYVGRVSVCAEAIAIGMAAAAGDTDIAVIVAVDSDGRVVTPCGMCREMILDYAPDALVLIDADRALPVRDLLPHKYLRHRP